MTLRRPNLIKRWWDNLSPEEKERIKIAIIGTSKATVNSLEDIGYLLQKIGTGTIHATQLFDKGLKPVDILSNILIKASGKLNKAYSKSDDLAINVATKLSEKGHSKLGKTVAKTILASKSILGLSSAAFGITGHTLRITRSAVPVAGYSTGLALKGAGFAVEKTAKGIKWAAPRVAKTIQTIRSIKQKIRNIKNTPNFREQLKQKIKNKIKSSIKNKISSIKQRIRKKIFRESYEMNVVENAISDLAYVLETYYGLEDQLIAESIATLYLKTVNDLLEQGYELNESDLITVFETVLDAVEEQLQISPDNVIVEAQDALLSLENEIQLLQESGAIEEAINKQQLLQQAKDSLINFLTTTKNVGLGTKLALTQMLTGKTIGQQLINRDALNMYKTAVQIKRGIEGKAGGIRGILTGNKKALLAAEELTQKQKNLLTAKLDSNRNAIQVAKKILNTQRNIKSKALSAKQKLLSKLNQTKTGIKNKLSATRGAITGKLQSVKTKLATIKK